MTQYRMMNSSHKVIMKLRNETNEYMSRTTVVTEDTRRKPS